MVLIAIGFAPLGECLSFICLKERHQRKGHPNPQPFGFLSLHSGIDGPALRHVLWRTPKLAVTYMDVGNAGFAGAKTCQWPIDPMALLNIGHSKGNLSPCQAHAIANIPPIILIDTAFGGLNGGHRSRFVDRWPLQGGRWPHSVAINSLSARSP